MRCHVPAAIAAAAVLLAPAGARAQQPSGGRWIVVYDPAAVDSVNRETAARERRGGFRSTLRFRHSVEGFSARLTAGQVGDLRADPDVAAVVPDRPVRAVAAQPLAPREPLAPTGVRRIGFASPSADPGWVREAGDVGVAVLDTGIDLDHPDLNAADGVDCIDPGTPAEDGNGHGTHVAGTIGAENDGAGVTGVGPGTKVHAVRVLDDEGSGWTSTLVCGLEWVIANAATRNIRVINMSLGGPGGGTSSCDPAGGDPMHTAICSARDAGILTTVAAMNHGTDIQAVPNDEEDPSAGTSPGVPASYAEVLTVAAINDHDGAPGAQGTLDPNWCGVDDRRAPYSNFATREADKAHIIAAPGTCITSTWPDDTYATIDGTSMATPHVAAAAALCIGEKGAPGPCAGLTPDEMIDLFISEARAYRLANPSYGFQGDPENPFPAGTSRYYGYLVKPLVAGPETSFASTPPETTDDRTPTFELASPNAGATFECSVDSGEFVACSTPFTTGELANGSHQVAVRAVDAAGNRDAAPATDSFTVDGPPAPPARTAPLPPPTDESPPRDTTPPTARLGGSSRQSLARVLREGLRVSVLCFESCRADLIVVIPARDAIRRRISKSAIAAGKYELPPGTGRRHVKLKLASSIRRRLVGARSVLVQVHVAATDASGNVQWVKKSVRLTR